MWWFYGLVDDRLKKLGKSPTRLALDNGLPRDAIRSVLRGHPPSIDRAKEIARALGLEFYIGPPRDPLHTGKNLIKTENESENVTDIAFYQAMKELRSAADVIRKATDFIGEAESKPKLLAVAEPRAEYGATRQVEVVELAATAGNGSADLDERVSGHLAFRRTWLNRRGLDPTQCIVISVRGESMEPTLPDGCSILVNRARRQRRFGHIYVLRTDDGVVVKRLDHSKDGSSWHLQSDHPAWSPAPWTDACEIIGEVRWMARDLG